MDDWRGELLSHLRNQRRAIDFLRGDKPNAKALKALIRAAVALNESKPKARR